MSVIQLKDVYKRYGSVEALKGINLNVEKGQIYGFIGPNGAGKTTTIRILLGIIKADHGSATIFDKDVWHEAVTIHKNIAYVPGDVKLWPNMTGGEVIDLLVRFRGNRAKSEKEKLIKAFNFDPSKKCRSYSKGNRQKVALIAALASDADVYLFDEPTSGLDPLMEKVFHDYVLSLKQKGKTILLSSHILSEVEKLCDTVSIIREGKIIESGKLDDLKHLTRTTIHLKTKKETDQLKTHEVIKNYQYENGTHIFQIDTKDMNKFLKIISELDILNFEIAPPKLEDLFMRHYQEDNHA